MLHIAVCDDDLDIHEQFKNYFLQYSKISSSTSFFVQYFPSSEELLRYYSLPGRFSFDLLFLDIEMDGISGIDLALKIRSLPDYTVQIIFLTHSPTYMLDSFNALPFSYQIKPLSYRTFHSLLERVCYYIYSVICPQIKLRTTSGDIIFQIAELVSIIKVDKVYVRINTLKETFHSPLTLVELSTILNHDFHQIHRSAIINLRHIHKFTSHTVVMRTKEILPLGRSHKNRVVAAHARYLSNRVYGRG